MSDISLVAELARMTAYFQLRTVAMHMGADPNAVDPDALTLTIDSNPQNPPHRLSDGLRPMGAGDGGVGFNLFHGSAN